LKEKKLFFASEQFQKKLSLLHQFCPENFRTVSVRST
jgi:hypothetical protein